MDIAIFLLGYFLQLSASCLLLVKITKQKSIFGLSIDTQYLLFASTCFRFLWMLETYLLSTPMAYVEMAASLTAGAVLCHRIHKLRHTTTMQADGFLTWPYLVPLAIGLALLLHPIDVATSWDTVGNDFSWMQVAIGTSMYLEALAMLPQLWIMNRMKDVEAVTGNYLMLLLASRVCRIVFWFVLYMHGDHYLSLFVADLVNSLLSLDYVYVWYKSVSSGQLVYRF